MVSTSASASTSKSSSHSSTRTVPKQWRLKKGMDRRFKSGHPWVYSNELQSSPLGIEPGEWVDLFDAGGEFLASGFGNPKSLIAFRACDRFRKTADLDLKIWVNEKLKAAQSFRERMGFYTTSHRLFFAESDGIPGLVIDRYLVNAAKDVVYVLQAQTAGAHRLLPHVIEALEGAPCIIKNGAEYRKLEGLELEEPKVVGSVAHLKSKLEAVKAQIEVGEYSAQLECDLVHGQKTGLFLDQRTNLEFLVNRLETTKFQSSTVRVLDLCTYVGQWSSLVAKVLKKRSLKGEFTLIDVSEPALLKAEANVKAAGAARVETKKVDVMAELTGAGLRENSFDLVICDPPALISSRKHIPVGKAAYVKLNTQALKLVGPGGLFVTCSCSGLLSDDDFLEVLVKASHKAQKPAKLLGRGVQSPDHSSQWHFPEGRYLKAWFAQC